MDTGNRKHASSKKNKQGGMVQPNQNSEGGGGTHQVSYISLTPTKPSGSFVEGMVGFDVSLYVG